MLHALRRILQFYGSEIWLYHSFQLPVAIGEFTHSFFDLPEMQKAVIHEMETFREEILKDLRSPVHIHVKAEASKLREGLAAFCEELQPDLVVIGLSGSDPCQAGSGKQYNQNHT